MKEKVNRALAGSSKEELVPTVVFSELMAAVEQGYRIVSLQGSARSGKTYNTTIFYSVWAYNNPNTKVAVVRSTMPRLKRTTYKDFKEVMNLLGIWEPRRMNETLMEYTFDNGSTVSFFATEDSGAAQGFKSDLLFVNEATEIEYSVWKQLIMRCQFKPLAIIDYNPNFSDDHWIKKLNTDPANNGILKFFKTTYKDNPYLPKEQVEEIESLKRTDERLWRIYGLGEQCLVEGLIYDNVEIVDAIPEYLEKRAYIGVDWGYKDPFAVVKVAIDKAHKDLYLKEICYKSMMSVSQQCEVLTGEECEGRVVICDNAAPQLKDEMLRLGVRIRAAKKITSVSAKSIVPGISAMKSFKIHITKDSVNGIIEANNYTWKRDRNGDYINEPIDKFNHFWDAARYVVYTVGIGYGIGGRGIRIH